MFQITGSPVVIYTHGPEKTILKAILLLVPYEKLRFPLFVEIQVLSQVTPKPDEVPRDVALQYSDRNRSTSYLPRKSHPSLLIPIDTSN